MGEEEALRMAAANAEAEGTHSPPSSSSKMGSFTYRKVAVEQDEDEELAENGGFE